MRIAFYIVCMAVIGVKAVDLQTQETQIQHRMLMQINQTRPEVTQMAGLQQMELAKAITPSKVTERVATMGLKMVDPNDRGTAVARNNGETTDSPRHPRVTVPRHMDGVPHFGGGHD